MKKGIRKFNWWIIPAVICGICAAVSIVYYLITVNLTLLFLILPAIAGTGFSIYKLVGYSGAFVDGISSAGPVVGDVNAFCIYGSIVNGEHLAEKVQFEKMEARNLLGDRWYFEDLGKWYHIIVNDIEGDNWKAFELPDAAYTDPARLAIQLNMGRTNELFQIEPSLFDQLKPWIIFAAISVIGFLIFLSGS